MILWRPPIDLGMIAAYHKMRAHTTKRRLQFDRVTAQTDRIIATIAADNCGKQLDRIEELQRQLRLITKGTPLTESLSPEDREPVLTSKDGFSQRQYDAHTELLKRAYRKLAMLCHPDRGGSVEAWTEVDVAYKMRDINRLNAIYLSLVRGRDIYWQQDEGVYHVSTEFHRYGVEMQMLQQTAGWHAARLHLSGAVNTAVDVVHTILTERIAALLNEIDYINQGNTNEQTEDEDQQQAGECRKIEG